MDNSSKILTSWAPIAGKWKFEANSATYVSPDPSPAPPLGIALSDAHLKNGTIETTVILPEKANQSEGKIIIGYRPLPEQYYYSVGIGGHGYAYVIAQFIPNLGWLALAGNGRMDNFSPNSQFKIKVTITGSRVVLFSDNVKVIEHNLPFPLNGDQVGLIAVGQGGVKFENTVAKPEKPRLFMVMEFHEPYQSLFEDVIRPIAEKEFGLAPFKADDIFKPGVILQDIIEAVTESEIIVVDITPPNQNVFYELGYAHALKKKTILMAERGARLPFDVSGFRVIFYDNTIKGKKEIEQNLAKHLRSIIEETS